MTTEQTGAGMVPEQTSSNELALELARQPLPLTVLVPSPVASYCYLHEALLWMAFQRVPPYVEDEEGTDARWSKDGDGIRPYVETDHVSDDECQRAGLPPDPEYAVSMAGDYYSRPQDIERLLKLDLEKADRAKLNADLLVSRDHYARADAWNEQFEHFVDLYKGRLFVALREGKIPSAGRCLPDDADESFPEPLTDEEWRAWANGVEWVFIPPTNWLSGGIDWDFSKARGVSKGYALILVSTKALMDAFPAMPAPAGQVLRLGDSFLMDSEPSHAREAKRGRPALNWDALHLELAKRVAEKALPLKQEALIAEMQDWCSKNWGCRVGRSTLLGKISPYYEVFVRSENR